MLNKYFSFFILVLTFKLMVWFFFFCVIFRFAELTIEEFRESTKIIISYHLFLKQLFHVNQILKHLGVFLAYIYTKIEIDNSSNNWECKAECVREMRKIKGRKETNAFNL